MSDITWTNEQRKLSDLIPQPDNPRQIREDEAGRLAESLEAFAQPEPIIIGPDNQLYNGHQRLNVWGAKYGLDLEVAVRVASRPLTHEEWQKLTVYLHRGAAGEWDFDALANWGLEDELLEWGFTEGELQWASDDLGQPDPAPEDNQILASYVPDAIFPSSNAYDIPDLKPDLQADFVELPIEKWGYVSRKSKMYGTYHFYTEDYKFNALWEKPLDLINSHCNVIIEPNFSTNEQMPIAVIMWGIYRKRWLARYAQNYGIKVFVDLNVCPKAMEYNMLGVPDGWKAYATRGSGADALPHIKAAYTIARNKAGTEPLFIVYGGGKDVRDYANEHGFIFIPENTDVKKGTVKGYGA